MRNDDVAQYRRCVDVTARVDYGDMRTVRANNRAVGQMYDIVERANRDAPMLAQLVDLLQDPQCARWLAHQLVERASISQEVERQCFQIVEALARDDQELGEKMWLSEWRAKRKRPR